MKPRIPTLPLAVITGLALSAASAVGQLASQYGILDLTANGGINPNTGVAWQVGDQYRLAFYSAGKTPGTSNNTADYDNFATAQANLSTLGNGAITTSTGWTALVWVNTDPNQAQGSALSNPAVRAGLNDFTGGAGIGGAGVPVYVMDGTTCIARNNADIKNSWSNPFNSDATLRLASGSTNLNSAGSSVTASQNVFYSPYLDQYGLGDSADVHGIDVITGGIFDSHVNAAGNITLAGSEDTTYSRGNTNANNTARIWNRFTDPTSTAKSVYAISPLLTVGLAGGEAFPLKITPNATTTGNYDFSWDSQDGKLYDLVSALDLTTAPATWAVWNGQMDLAATSPTNTLANIPGGGDTRRFFAVIEKDAPPPPPLLDATFDAGDDGFTASKTAGTDWVRGMPTSTGLGGTVSTDNSGTGSCWGTNIGNPGFYVNPTTATTLRSPNINLSTVGAAELNFAQALDFPGGDTATVRIFKVSDDSEITSGPFPLTVLDGNTSTADWASAGPYALPVGEAIYIKWIFSGTGGGTADYMGWYVDDVLVTGTAP